MKSPLAVRQGVQVPRVRHAPTVRANSWEDVSDLCAAYGLVLDDWQEGVLEGALGERSDGKWAASQVGVAVSRQNGKGELIVARELAGILLFGEQLLIHSAHQVATALEGFNRIRAYFENFDDLSKLVKRVRESHTEQGIEFKSGQRLRFMARSKNTGRGFSADCLLLDEAQELSDDTWAAMLPTISARENPQFWLLGTPPSPLMNGEVFTRLRATGHEGKERHLAWFEWSAENGADLDSREAWAQANPGLYLHIDPQRIIEERTALDDDAFARERLGMWSSAGSQSVIDARTWAAAGDVHSIAGDRFSLAVDIAPDFQRAAVSFAGQRPDGLWHVELDEQTGPGREGVSWVAPYVIDRIRKNPQIRAVAVDAIHRTLIDELRKEKIKVTVAQARDVASACGQFYVGIAEQWLRHTGQPQMATAVAMARKRPLGDTWAWNRKHADSDITPLVACTLALWGAQTSTAKRPTSGSTGRKVVVMA